jgi:hypothetical protein
MNLQDNKNMQFPFGSDGVLLVELLGRMFTLFHTMMQLPEPIMLEQEIEFYQFSNTLITESSSVHTLPQKIMMPLLKSSLKHQYLLLIKLLGFMLTMLTAEKLNQSFTS